MKTLIVLSLLLFIAFFFSTIDLEACYTMLGFFCNNMAEAVFIKDKQLLNVELR